MRKFEIACRDTVTGHQMILSECTYNMACDWLERELQKKGLQIGGCKCDDSTNLVEIWTAGTTARGDIFIGRTYYYDEARGYLLGE